MIHDLKIWPEFFKDLLSGSKTFELRKDDRPYAVGDTLRLREWDPSSQAYTGLYTERDVSYILRHRPDAGCAATFGLSPGFAIMALTGSSRPNVPDADCPSCLGRGEIPVAGSYFRGGPVMLPCACRKPTFMEP